MKKFTKTAVITTAVSLIVFSGCSSNKVGPDEISDNEMTETLTEKTTASYADDKTLEEFNSVFDELLAKFEEVSAEVISDDNVTLKPEYSAYQSDFDKILEEINILGDYIDNDSTDNEYFNKMTEKGRNILGLLNDFASKTNLN